MVKEVGLHCQVQHICPALRNMHGLPEQGSHAQSAAQTVGLSTYHSADCMGQVDLPSSTESQVVGAQVQIPLHSADRRKLGFLVPDEKTGADLTMPVPSCPLSPLVLLFSVSCTLTAAPERDAVASFCTAGHTCLKPLSLSPHSAMLGARRVLRHAMMALARLPLLALAPGSWSLHGGTVRNLVFALQRVPPARLPAPGQPTTGYGNALPPVVHRVVSHTELRPGRLILIGRRARCHSSSSAYRSATPNSCHREIRLP
jgi:hypothetical protein